MRPDLVRFGPLTLHGYGTMVALGLVVSWFVLSHEARRKGLVALEKGMLSLYGWMLLAGYVGGKLYYVASSYEEFLGIWRTGDVAKIVGKGFVFYGSLLTCIPTLWWWLKKRGIPFLPALDVAIFSAPIMLGFGRVGCFLAGCCYGEPCDLPWSVRYPASHATHGASVHPAPLYETAGCAVVFAALWFFVRPRARFDGQIVAWYFVLYGIERFLVELFRGDAARGVYFGGSLGFSQVLSIPLVVLGLVWLRHGSRRAQRPPPTRAERRRAP
jgi:phosphatidylglycerol---prolipoprotein diacylglyceryl transferase